MQRFLEGDVPVIDAVFKHKSYLRGFSNSEEAGRWLDRNLPTVCSSLLEIHICCPRVWQRKKQWTSPFFSLKQCGLKSASKALVVSNTVTAKANQSDPSQDPSCSLLVLERHWGDCEGSNTEMLEMQARRWLRSWDLFGKEGINMLRSTQSLVYMKLRGVTKQPQTTP